MARSVHIQYRGRAVYIDRDNPAAVAGWLDEVDEMQDDPYPLINDHVVINAYKGRQDDGGRIIDQRDAGNGDTEYRVNSWNMPYCGSIDGWFRHTEFTIRPRG